MRSTSTEITEEETTPCEALTEKQLDHVTAQETSVGQERSPKIVTRGTYDGEISFGSSWKKVEIRQDSGEITSIAEEDASVMSYID